MPFQHPPAVPSDLDAILVAPEFRLPADLALDHETSSAWDRFTDWYAVRKEHAEQHNPVMRVTTRIPGKRIDILDSRFDEPQTWMLLDERAVVYDLCHDGSTFNALNDRCAVDRHTLKSAIDELTANELLICVDDRYLSLALRPGHLVIKDHLAARDPVREASPDEVLMAQPPRSG